MERAQNNAPRPVVRAGTRGLVPKDLDELFRMCTWIAKSGLTPYGMDAPEKVMVAVQAGMEVGISPMAAIQNSMVLKGKHSFYGDIVLGLVLGSPECVGWKEWYTGTPQTDDYTAHCLFKRRNGIEREGTFSHKQAKEYTSPMKTKSGWVEKSLLEKDNYKNDYDGMLMWRARHRAMKLFSDILKGVRITEVAEDFPDEPEDADWREIPHAGELPAGEGNDYEGPSFSAVAESEESDGGDEEEPAPRGMTAGEKALAEIRDAIDMADSTEMLDDVAASIPDDQHEAILDEGLTAALDAAINARRQALKRAGV